MTDRAEIATKQACINCVFFEVFDAQTRGVVWLNEGDAHCRRYPPRSERGQPYVHTFGWCGEWRQATRTVGANGYFIDVNGETIK